MSKGILDIVQPGVLFGEDVQKVYNHAKQEGFAIPAVNVIGTDSINGVLEAAAKVKSPVIIQFSNGGASYNAGKGLSNADEKAAIVGAVSGAIHVHMMAQAYGVAGPGFSALHGQVIVGAIIDYASSYSCIRIVYGLSDACKRIVVTVNLDINSIVASYLYSDRAGSNFCIRCGKFRSSHVLLTCKAAYHNIVVALLDIIISRYRQYVTVAGCSLACR